MPESTLRERIQAVSNAEADGEQLVSVAVAPDDSLTEMRDRVESEHAEAEYLDVREEVRKPLRQALEGTRRVLHEYEETPENGLAVYVGIVGDELVEYTFDDLPSPISASTYEHANEFDTDPLEPSTSDTSTVGLLVVARERAVLGRYDGTRIEQLTTVESDVPSKQAAAGRDEDRFEGRSDERREEFFDSVGEAASRAFLEGGGDRVGADDAARRRTAVSGLLLGGSDVTVEQFRDGDHLSSRLADALGGTFDVEYASEQGLRQLVDAAESTDTLETTEASEALDRFFEALDDEDSASAVGGRADVEEALAYGAVETLLVADSLPAEEVRDFEATVEEEGGTCVVVPGALDRAERLREGFDGVGAILRFPVA